MAEGVATEPLFSKVILGHLECSICCTRYNQPKNLDCSHSYCLKCLQELKKAQTPDTNKLKCPLCQKETILPLDGVTGLQNNYLLIALVEEVNKQEQLPQCEESKVMCQACDEENEAISRCLNCEHYLCQECQKAHQRFTALKNHKIKTLAEMQEVDETQAESKMNISRCDVHPMQELCYKAKSGHTWSVHEPTPARLPRANILRQASGPRNIEGATSILDFWKLFFPDRVLDNILRYTNEQGVRERGRSWVNLVMMELLTVLGLLYFLGLCKAAHEQVRDFWKPGMFARPVCQAAMKADRFQEILRMMRFDDKATREQRKATDKFAAIRDVFDEFVNNCRRYFNPGENVTVDEELVAFRGRCGFRQYMPKKPARYGIKFWVCTDSTHNYITNIQPYLGKENNTRETKLGKRVVLDMVRPLFKTGRNITADSYFTSCELAEELLQEDLTLLGTIKGLRREVPDIFKPKASKKREAKSSKFLFAGPLTLVSYVPRKSESVLLLSSMHHDSAINDATSKPEMIHDYNHTKAGVDTIDQMCSVYNVARITRRWPMVVFYNIMNLAAINAYTLYGLKNPGWHPKGSARSAFLSQLAKELMHPQYMLRAANASRLAPRTRRALETIGYELQHPRQPLPEANRPGHSRLKNGYCFLCEGTKGRTTKVCESCRRFACAKHSTMSRPVNHCHECLGFY